MKFLFFLKLTLKVSTGFHVKHYQNNFLPRLFTGLHIPVHFLSSFVNSSRFLHITHRDNIKELLNITKIDEAVFIVCSRWWNWQQGSILWHKTITLTQRSLFASLLLQFNQVATNINYHGHFFLYFQSFTVVSGTQLKIVYNL